MPRPPRLKVTYIYKGGRTHDRLSAVLELCRGGQRGTRVWWCEHDHREDEEQPNAAAGYGEQAAIACGVEAFRQATGRY